MVRKRKRWPEIVFVLAAVSVGLIMSFRPWQGFSDQRQVRDSLVKEMKQSEKRSEELIRQKARAESSVGAEELARKSGYHRPGEMPIDP